MGEELKTGLIEQLGSQVAALLNEATPEQHEFFYTKLNISNQARHDFVVKCFRDLGQKILDNQKPSNVIPCTIHRLWLTDNNNPNLPLQYYIDRIKQQAIAFGNEYEYIFWHNSNIVASRLAETFADVGVQFRDIATLGPDSQILERIYHAIAARKFVLAGDISKFLIMKECGGVYADLGIDFEKSLISLMKYSDLTLFLDQNLFFQPAFMATAPNSRIFSDWCKLLSKPEIVGSFTLGDCERFEPAHEIWLHGGVGFTGFLMLDRDEPRLVVTVPANRGLLRHESEGSWYRPGDKFGNITLENASVTHLDWRTHCDLISQNNEMSGHDNGRDPADTMRMIRRHIERLTE